MPDNNDQYKTSYKNEVPDTADETAEQNTETSKQDEADRVKTAAQQETDRAEAAKKNFTVEQEGRARKFERDQHAHEVRAARDHDHREARLKAKAVIDEAHRVNSEQSFVDGLITDDDMRRHGELLAPHHDCLLPYQALAQGEGTVKMAFPRTVVLTRSGQEVEQWKQNNLAQTADSGDVGIAPRAQGTLGYGTRVIFLKGYQDVPLSLADHPYLFDAGAYRVGDDWKPETSDARAERIKNMPAPDPAYRDVDGRVAARPTGYELPGATTADGRPADPAAFARSNIPSGVGETAQARNDRLAASHVETDLRDPEGPLVGHVETDQERKDRLSDPTRTKPGQTRFPAGKSSV